MDIDSLLHRHFDETAKDSAHARAMAKLAAAWDETGAASDLSAAELAAYLDGGLSPEARRAVEAKLAHSPEALADALAANDFLQTVEAETSKVVAFKPRKSLIPWLALAMAAAIMGGLVLLNRAPPPTDRALPVASQSPAPAPEPPPPVVAEKKTAQPVMVPAASGERAPGGQTPKPKIKPAASEDVAPAPRGR